MTRIITIINIIACIVLSGCHDFDVEHEYYKNGQLKSSTEEKDGKSHGIQKIYNEEGVLIEENIFEEGLKEGVSYLYSNQVLREEVFYKQGKIIWKKEFYPDGSIYELISYNEYTGCADSLVRFEQNGTQAIESIPLPCFTKAVYSVGDTLTFSIKNSNNYMAEGIEKQLVITSGVKEELEEGGTTLAKDTIELFSGRVSYDFNYRKKLVNSGPDTLVCCLRTIRGVNDSVRINEHCFAFAYVVQ